MSIEYLSLLSAVFHGRYSVSAEIYFNNSNGFVAPISLACENENASLINCARFLVGIAYLNF